MSKKRVNYDALKRECQDVRASYFPRFDKQRAWRVFPHQCVRFRFKINEGFSSSLRGAYLDLTLGRLSGLCDRKRKLIVVEDFPDSPLELTVTLIHEIAHATAGGHNAKAWKPRMEKAIKRAEQLGRFDIVSGLQKELVPNLERAKKLWEERKAIRARQQHSPKAADNVD